MQQQETITKFTAEITRDNGAQVRIVATQMGSPFHTSIDVYVLRRDNASDNWKLCSKDPHPDWRVMSVEKYVKHGRSEMLQAVSHGEILKTVNMIGKPLTAADTFH